MGKMLEELANAPNKTKPSIRCLHCDCNQFIVADQANCRRCHQPLPKMDVVHLERVREVIIERVVEKPCLTCPLHGHTMPTFKELERMLYTEAVSRYGVNVERLSMQLQVGRTTVYRKLREFSLHGGRL